MQMLQLRTDSFGTNSAISRMLKKLRDVRYGRDVRDVRDWLFEENFDVGITFGVANC